MENSESWDKYFLRQLDYVKNKSKDNSTKVGAIVVGKHNQVVSQGFNGFAQKIIDDISIVPERYERPLKYDLTLHAEMNSILFSCRNGVVLDGCKIYSSLFPCISCVNAIIQVGIIEVVTWKIPTDGIADRWDFTLSRQILNEANIKVTEYEIE